MLDTLTNLSPIFLFFILGVVLKKVEFAEPGQADFLLKFVFFITLPALVLLRLSQTDITLDKIYLPLINMAINLACMGICLILFRPARLSWW